MDEEAIDHCLEGEGPIKREGVNVANFLYSSICGCEHILFVNASKLSKIFLSSNTHHKSFLMGLVRRLFFKCSRK